MPVAPRFPEFKDELDLDALEQWAIHITEALGRGTLPREPVKFLKGLLWRASPQYRDKVTANQGTLAIARYDDWISPDDQDAIGVVANGSEPEE